MKRIKKFVLAGSLGLAILTAGTGLTALAASGTITVGAGMEKEESIPVSIPVWGTITSVHKGGVVIDNVSGNSSPGEMVIKIAPEETRILDGVNGFPVQESELKEGDFIYAYLGQVMTMSLPPQVTAEMIFCQVPTGAKSPEYVSFTTVAHQEDGSAVVTCNNGRTYTVAADCPMLPFLTRNIVRVGDIQKGGIGILWSADDASADKMVLFQN